MHKKLKLFILSFLSIFMALFIVRVNVSASTYDDINQEVAELIEQGKLPSYHSGPSITTGYQTIYTKMYKFGDDTTRKYFKQMTLKQLTDAILIYQNGWNDVLYNILNNLDVEPQYLDPDRVLGLYYDSNLDSEDSYLYLVWTSKYIPSEFMTIHSLELNGKTYTQYPNEDLFDPFWYDSIYYHYNLYDLTIHLTPIGGFRNGKHYGVPLTQKYEFKNIKTGIDKMQFDYDPDPTNEFSSTINSYATFDLGLVPEYHKQSACQLVTHAYKLIKDCEVQSYYDLGFGGYIHMVHFNTTIPIDRIYRVDVSYTLTSDNKDWYQFWLQEEKESVTKSLRPEKKNTGIFGLYEAYGFKEGEFKSNQRESITYKYEMMLNYSEQNWDWFGPYCTESNYKRITDFKVLRLNYLVDETTYDVNVKMDRVDGKTLSIIDRNLILDTDSTLYKVKDKVYSIADGFELTKNIALSVIGVIGFLLVFYYLYKFIIYLKKAANNE